MNLIDYKGKNIDQNAPKPKEMGIVPTFAYLAVAMMMISSVGSMFGYSNMMYRMFGWMPGALWEWIKWVFLHL